MIRYVLRQNSNELSKVFGKFFAFPVIEETVDLSGLSEHMSSHNTPFSKGVIKGLLTDMVNCIKELLLEGKNVKIDDLAIFSIGIKNQKGGADTEEDFSVTKNIQSVKLRSRASVKLRSRATGILVPKALNLVATLRRATALTGTQSTDSNASGDNTGNDEPRP